MTAVLLVRGLGWEGYLAKKGIWQGQGARLTCYGAVFSQGSDWNGQIKLGSNEFIGAL